MTDFVVGRPFRPRERDLLRNLLGRLGTLLAGRSGSRGLVTGTSDRTSTGPTIRTPRGLRAVARGVIPVAILGSESLDADEVDVATLAFGPEGAAPAHDQAVRRDDVDGDGFVDLVSHYRTEETARAAARWS